MNLPQTKVALFPIPNGSGVFVSISTQIVVMEKLFTRNKKALCRALWEKFQLKKFSFPKFVEISVNVSIEASFSVCLNLNRFVLKLSCC